MFFYNFDLLDNFIKSDFICNLKKEQENVIQMINLYHNKKMNFSNVTTNIMLALDLTGKKQIEEDFYKTITSFKNSFERLENIELLANKLNDNLILTISLYNRGLENNINEIKANLVEYNKQRDELFNKIIEFENYNISTSNFLTQLFFKLSDKKIKKAIFDEVSKEKVSKINIEENPHDNNVLLVSEKDQKAYLPFFYSEVKKIYKDTKNQYLTLQDVVDDLYVIPLNKFQNSSISRFREAFNLIRNKEHSSIIKAFDLGLEVMFKHELNPVVIAACRNIDELDIYLDCLEENELYDFTCFEIKFEITPQKKK